MNQNINQWNIVFKTFNNINKMKIVDILSRKGQRTVTQIADDLNISFKATSKHLVELNRVGVLVSKGKSNRVYYYINLRSSTDFKRTISLFTRPRNNFQLSHKALADAAR